jgi:hypothetical protein
MPSRPAASKWAAWAGRAGASIWRIVGATSQNPTTALEGFVPCNAPFRCSPLSRCGETFQRHCASCHGLSATGDGPAAGALRLPLPPADLTRIAERRGGAFPTAEVARFIDGRFFPTAHGSREMPIWGERFGAWIPESSLSEEITRGRIVTLVEYLKSIQRGD